MRHTRRPNSILLMLALALAAAGCGGATSQTQARRAQGRDAPDARPADAATAPTPEPHAGTMIHVLVALCDNVNQGIVPVPEALGNGEDPQRNLYWGARFGVRTHFARDKDWRLVAEVKNPKPPVLERLIFKHAREDAYLVADAYRGSEIKRATTDFLDAAAGVSRETVSVGGRSLGLARGARRHLVAYVGHDGLMDFSLDYTPKRQDDEARDAVVLACASKSYFAAPLRETGARPLLWTTGLMAPEAYVLDAALDGWLAGEGGEQVRRRAAAAYHKYQNCGLRAAQRLFATGW